MIFTKLFALSKARNLIKNGNRDEAQALLRDLVATQPNNAEAWDLLGRTYYSQEKYKEAYTAHNRAVELSPANPLYLLNRARALTDLDEFDRAIQDCNAAIRINPNHPEGYYYRGNAYRFSERYVEAMEDYSQVMRINPRLGVYSSRADCLCHLGRWREALEDLDLQYRMNPNDTETLFMLARANWYTGNSAAALDLCNRTLELDPNECHTLYNRACYNAALGRVSVIESDLTRAIKSDEKFREMAKNDPDFDSVRDKPEYLRAINC